MENKIILFLILFLVSIMYSQDQNIIGKWENIGEKNYISGFDFNSDNTAIMYSNNLSSPPFNLSIDTTKNPAWLDMKLYKDGFLVIMQGLFEFVDESTIRLMLYKGAKNPRPEEFNEERDKDILFILQKYK